MPCWWRTRPGGQAASLRASIAALADAGVGAAVARVTSEDSFVPLGAAARTVLLSQHAIETAARKLLA